ncbi:MAG: sigma 54-interacting transcriptional regulator [Desulfuromonadales bacterium]
MKKILFAWTGNQDFKAAEENNSSSLGAICMAATSREFDELVLLSDANLDKTTRYREWLASKQVKNVQVIAIDLGGNPNDYKRIYEAAKSSIQDYLKHSKSEVELTFHLAPGTPAMATIWVILAPVFSAKLIHSSPERGVKDVEFPFSIVADYLPDLQEKMILAHLSDHGPESAEFEKIIHQSEVMKNQITRARIVAPYPVPVLIYGESGTGKELFAEAIHNASQRKHKPFKSINCGAIPVTLFESVLFGHIKGAFTGADEDKVGLIEAAEGGTLFLDEIGELPHEIQAKLLRVLNDEDKKFSRVGESSERSANVRIISATNRNLVEEIAKNNFRDDLFYRLAVGILNLPPLREREGDIRLLVDHLMKSTIKKLALKTKKFSNSAYTSLLSHPWPGNVRELKSTLTRAALWSRGSIINEQDIEDAKLPVAKESQNIDTILGRSLQSGFDLKKVIGEVAEHYLERAMKEAGGNKTKAAESLNFNSYQAIDVWLKRYDICIKKT